MKRSYFIFLLFFFFAGCLQNNEFKDYRYNPFQFPYPEYYLKADRVDLTKKTPLEPLKNPVNINFFGLTTAIESEWFDSVGGAKGTKKYTLKGKTRFILYTNKELRLGCDDEGSAALNRDFCSGFRSSKEFFEKLYTLTPADLEELTPSLMGDSWIIHRKGWLFERTKNIMIYENPDFIAFRRDFNGGSRGKIMTEIHLFRPQTETTWITLGMEDCPEAFVDQFLLGLHVNEG